MNLPVAGALGSDCGAALVMGISLFILLAGSAFAQTGGTFDLTWNTIDSGGGTSTGGAFTLTGTIGQPDAGAMSGGMFTLAGGFGVSGGTSVVLGDCNFDGVVDLFDYEQFASCVTGPGVPLDPACACNDLDDDDDVDLHDFGILQTLFAGT